MSTCYEIKKGIFVSLSEAKELYKILKETDENKKSSTVKVLEKYLSKYVRG